MSLNQAQFIGNLGSDPEVRAIQNGVNAGSSFTTFSIAINNKSGKNQEEKPLWINITCFGKTGEFAGKYLKKGSQVFVQGTLELQEYEGKDGKNHTSVKVLASKVESLSKSSSGTNGTEPVLVGAGQKSAPITEEDIPF